MGTPKFSPKKSVYQIESIFASRRRRRKKMYAMVGGNVEDRKGEKLTHSLFVMFYFFCQSVKEKFRNETLRCVVFLFFFPFETNWINTKDKKRKKKRGKTTSEICRKSCQGDNARLMWRSLLLAGVSGEERRNLTTNLLADRNERKTEGERSKHYVCHTCCFRKYEIHPSCSVKLFVRFLFILLSF